MKLKSAQYLSTATASLPSPWQFAHRAWHFSPLPLAFARNIVKFIAFEEFPGRKQSSKNLTFEENVHTSLGGCYYMSLVFEDCMRVGFSTFAKSVMKTAQLKEAQNQSTWKPKLLFELEADLLLLDKIEFTEMVKTQQSNFDSDIHHLNWCAREILHQKNNHNDSASLRAPHTIFLVMELIRGGRP